MYPDTDFLAEMQAAIQAADSQAGRIRVQDTCKKCGRWISGVSTESLEQAQSRLQNNMRLHMKGKKCR